MGLLDSRVIRRRWDARISVEIWWRAARMVRACWPNTEEPDVDEDVLGERVADPRGVWNI